MEESCRSGILFPFDARLISVPRIMDERGELMPIAFEEMPFEPKRLFSISNVPAGTIRGRHGHRFGQQLLFCLQGQIEVVLKNTHEERTVLLKENGPGLLLGPGVWSQQKYVTKHAVLLVLASESYDSNSYFYDWNNND